MVKPFLFREPPGSSGHADDGAGPLLHRPFPASGSGVVGFVDDQQVAGVVAVPYLPAGVAPAHGLGHENHRAAGHGRSVLARRPVDVGDGGDAGVGEHPPGLLGQFLAVGEPDGLSTILQPIGQQRAGDDGFAAAGGQLQHQTGPGFGGEPVLHLP